jgi:hypothetical protein
MSAEYFTVASYDVEASQDTPVSTASGSWDGRVRALTLRSASDNPTRMKADLRFTTLASAIGVHGFVVGLGTTSIHVFTGVPLEDFDHWLDLLKGDRQVSFMFFYDDGAEVSSDVSLVRLTTAQDPNEMFSLDRSSDRIRALPRELQRIVVGPE